MRFEVGDLIETDPDAHDWNSLSKDYRIICEINNNKGFYCVYLVDTGRRGLRLISYTDEYWRKVE